MTAFHELDEQIGHLRAIGPRLKAREESAEADIRQLAKKIRRTVSNSADGAIAAVHLFNRYARPVELSVYHAVLCEILGQQLELDEDAAESLIAAALSVNIPFWELQDELNIQKSALSDEQRAAVHRHPGDAVTMLNECKITDASWLTIAEQHHERPDGRGYPAGTSGDQIDRLALVLHIAESYCAAITDRDYRLDLKRRKRYHATQVLHEFHQISKEISVDLLQLLIKALGVYPPGTWVRLANNEISMVVSRQQQNGSKPIVASFGRGNHTPFPRPLMRDTSDSEYRVSGISAPPIQRAKIHMSSLWPDQ